MQEVFHQVLFIISREEDEVLKTFLKTLYEGMNLSLMDFIVGLCKV